MIQDIAYAERSLLGALIVDNAALSRVQVEPDDFLDRRNRAVFVAIQRLVTAGTPADTVTLAQELGAERSMSYLLDVASTNYISDNVEFYADAVRAEARRRKFLIGLGEVYAAVKSDDDDATMRARVQAFLDNTVDSTLASTSTPLSEVIQQVYEADLTSAITGKPSEDIMSTGLMEMDVQIGGLPVGIVTVVGGRPGMGKSALARTLALNVSHLGVGAHVFSMEDNRSAYARRCLSDFSGVTLSRIAADVRDPRVERAAKDAARYRNVLLDDATGWSAAQIAMRVRAQIKANRTKLVVVDYVQIMSEPEAKRDDSRQQVKISIEGLAKLARSENVAMLVVSQLNRLVESRTDKRPTLADLREAGELEQVANLVLLCYRDEYYNPDSKRRGYGEVIVAKNKNGATGTVELAWDAPTATFRSRFRAAREPGSDDE